MQIPKNVVQAGDVDPCHKIYIEDYVYTYLSQNRSGDKSADFCLYGKTETEGEVRYYFIYGAAKEGPILSRYTRTSPGKPCRRSGPGR